MPIYGVTWKRWVRPLDTWGQQHEGGSLTGGQQHEGGSRGGQAALGRQPGGQQHEGGSLTGGGAA